MNNKEKIVLLGASGFIGSHILSSFVGKNIDITAVVVNKDKWRLETHLQKYCLESGSQNIQRMLDIIKPTIIINTIAHGGYSFQKQLSEMLISNVEIVDQLAFWALKNRASIIHLGSSSEYGTNCRGPLEGSKEFPNSKYAITKLAGTQLLAYYSQLGLRSVVLRLYSVYGPKEDPSRLMPSIIRGILTAEWPKFTDLNISRDFIYVNDVLDLIERVCSEINQMENFEIFNVGTGLSTTLRDLSAICTKKYGMPYLKVGFIPREWDLSDWYANISKVKEFFHWQPKYDLELGLEAMKKWYEQDNNIEYLTEKFTARKP